MPDMAWLAGATDRCRCDHTRYDHTIGYPYLGCTARGCVDCPTFETAGGLAGGQPGDTADE